jgi:hypothetical protein
MGVNIDEARRDDASSCIDFFFARAFDGPDRADLPGLDGNIGFVGRATAPVDYQTAPDDNIIGGRVRCHSASPDFTRIINI